MGLSFPSGDVEGLEDSLRKRVQERKRDAAMYKDFVKRMYDLENELDFISAEDQKSMVENTKRRRRSTTLDVDEILYTAVDEAAKDLRKILGGEKDLDAFIENNALNIKGSVFTKGDKIKVRIKREEFVGAIVSIGEEDIILKTKEYKRLKILLDDIRSTKSSIIPINEIRH